jgi:hypothetical protein
MSPTRASSRLAVGDKPQAARQLRPQLDASRGERALVQQRLGAIDVQVARDKATASEVAIL